MKIQKIEALRLTRPDHQMTTKPRREPWEPRDEVANPMSRYGRFKQHRKLWRPTWEDVWCRVTLEDGTSGLGSTINGRPVAAVIEDHLGPHLIGESVFATDKIADMMFRLTRPYGTAGLASYAISAIDLAIWDALGNVLERPVYELIGGPKDEKIQCYATGNDVDWYQELGFRAFKLACPYGPADGSDGIRRNEESVAGVRDQIGDEADLMLDCWMAFDVEYTVQLAETLRPYRIKWIEETLLPDDLDSHLALRSRIPWQTLSTGEHWYTHVPFQWAAAHRAVDILQPDINWVGGLSTTKKIGSIADAAGLSVILHAGGNNPFGQHFSIATPNVPWLECFVGTPPGVPLEEAWILPGQARPENGYLKPSNAPGFGLEIPGDWFTPFFSA
jgi:L-rhamnonate dehydratase